jgi:hypothetical protein
MNFIAGFPDFLTMVGSELVPHQQVSTMPTGNLIEQLRLVWYFTVFLSSSAAPLPSFDSLRDRILLTGQHRRAVHCHWRVLDSVIHRKLRF